MRSCARNVRITGQTLHSPVRGSDARRQPKRRQFLSTPVRPPVRWQPYVVAWRSNLGMSAFAVGLILGILTMSASAGEMPKTRAKHTPVSAADREFWSFQRIREPEIPPAGPGASSSGSVIDRFVREKLAANGISPAPEADRVTLIRRATFDLHGLPP